MNVNQAPVKMREPALMREAASDVFVCLVSHKRNFQFVKDGFPNDSFTLSANYFDGQAYKSQGQILS